MIALTETSPLADVYGWAQVVVWILVIAMATVCAFNTAVPQNHSDRVRR